MIRARRSLLSLALVASLLAGVEGRVEPVAPSAVGDVHMLFYGYKGFWYDHTVRHADGSWQQAASAPAGGVGMQSTMVGPEFHVFTWFYDGWRHSVRYFDGTWNSRASVPVGGGAMAPPFRIGVAHVGGVFHLLRLVDGRVEHASQHPDGTWSVFANPPMPGLYADIAASVVGTDLRVVGISADGTTVTRTDRHSDGTWSPAVGTGFGTDSPPSRALEVEAAQVGDDLHVVVLDDQGDVYHSIMHENLAWDLFRDIDPAAGDSGEVYSIGATASQGTLHVAVGNHAVDPGRDDRVLHTIRYPDRSWQRYGDVKDQMEGMHHTSASLTIAGS
jgi:hypothetical protein